MVRTRNEQDSPPPVPFDRNNLGVISSGMMYFLFPDLVYFLLLTGIQLFMPRTVMAASGGGCVLWRCEGKLKDRYRGQLVVLVGGKKVYNVYNTLRY